MFLSHDSLPTSSADWVGDSKTVQKKLVKLVEHTRQLERDNFELTQEIAECKRAEEALRQVEQRYRSFFENATEGIFQTTPDGRYLICNSALAHIYGYASVDELLEHLTDIEQQLYVYPQRRQEFIEQLNTHGVVREFESQVYRQDGSIIWICENARAVYDEQGALLYYEGFVTDITERKLAEESRQQSQEQLAAKTEQLEQALSQLQQAQSQLIHHEKMSNLGQLLAGIAHEINNPVNFVCGNLIPATQYVEDLLALLQLYAQFYPQPVPEIQAKVEAIDVEFLMEDFPKTLSSMKLGAERIRQIVQSLRNFSWPDEAQMSMVDIHQSIDSTLLILNSRLKPKGNNPGIVVIRDYTEIPLVKGYAGLLNQVFMNLVCNAIDALEDIPTTDNDAIEVENPNRSSYYNVVPCECESSINLSHRELHLDSITEGIEFPVVSAANTPKVIKICTDVLSNEAEGETSQPERVVIRIIDNGLGVSEEIRSQIFNPFFTTKPVGKGTGLGLSISYQIIVDKHGGQLQCLSAPEQGTEFRIEIPIQPSLEVENEEDNP
jgi:PAS domain S-box-containing protein